MTIFQFIISRAAADAVSIATIKRGALTRGVVDLRFDYAYADRRTCRVTSSMEMAAYLIEQLRQAALAAEDPSTIVECLKGATAIFSELSMESHAPSGAPWPERRRPPVRPALDV